MADEENYDNYEDLNEEDYADSISSELDETDNPEYQDNEFYNNDKEVLEKFEETTESIKDVLKTELVSAKFNKEFTSEVVLNNLSSSFIILSNLLEDSKLARENMDRLFSTLDKLKVIVEAMKDSADKMNDISQIVDQLNDLAVAFSVSNSNVEKLITIIGELTSKHKELEKDLNELKSANFYNKNSSNNSSEAKSSSGNIIVYGLQLMSLALLAVLVIYK